jgi:glycosyltransferase involved in cell wall biosynthesis
MIKNKILFLSYSDKSGGAAIGMYRTYQILKKKYDIKILVRKKITSDPNIIQIGNTYFNYLRNLLSLFLRLFFIKDYSLNILPSRILHFGNSFNIINLHWIGGETVSLKEIINSPKKIVITLHDMWFFNGGYHYLNNKKKLFFMAWLDKYLFHYQKKISKKNNIYFISPSNWIKNQLITRMNIDADKISVIPYPRLNFYKSINLNRNNKNNFIKKGIFISANNINDTRKGFDLLNNSLKLKPRNDLKLIIVSKNFEKKKIFHHDFEGYDYLNEKQIFSLFKKVDFLIFTSRQDNLPNVIIESLSYNRPVLAFNIGGVGDLIQHKFNGYLANPFELNDFNKGLDFIIRNHQILSNNISSDKRFMNNFSKKNIIKRYSDLIYKINNNKKINN